MCETREMRKVHTNRQIGRRTERIIVLSLCLFAKPTTNISMNMDKKKCVSNKHTCQSNYVLSHWHSEKFNLTDSNGLANAYTYTHMHTFAANSQVVFDGLSDRYQNLLLFFLSLFTKQHRENGEIKHNTIPIRLTSIFVNFHLLKLRLLVRSLACLLARIFICNEHSKLYLIERKKPKKNNMFVEAFRVYA